MPFSTRLVIRLKNKGRANYRVYDVIVTHKHKSTASGKYFEKLGFYNPNWRENMAWLNMERIYYWINKGAVPVGVTARMIMMFELYTRKNQSWKNWPYINPQFPTNDWKTWNPYFYPNVEETKQRIQYADEYMKQLKYNIKHGITVAMEKKMRAQASQEGKSEQDKAPHNATAEQNTETEEENTDIKDQKENLPKEKKRK